MLFSFLKYLQPTDYFRLYNKSGQSVFPKVHALPKQVEDMLIPDANYESAKAKEYDMSWRAIQNGYIGDAETYTNFDNLPLKDNYRFIRKNFHSLWVFFVLIVRLFSFHNPFEELSAWLSTNNAKRKQLKNQSIKYPKWESFESELIAKQPKVSVVIPTLNRYEYLKDVLSDFEQQDYSNFEIIIVDQSEPYIPEFYKDYKLDIKLIRQEEKALWLARNTAIRNSTGQFIALSEDDVRIQPNWITSHLKCLDFFDAKVSAGVFYPEGQQVPRERSFFSIASQFATGNAILYKDIFKSVGLFDRQFEKQRMGDGEFGLRVYLEGIRSVSNPLASCVDVKAGTGGLREMGSWDAFRPSTFFAPRPIPSVIYFFRSYFGKRQTQIALLRMVPLSIFPYQFKKNKALLVLGVLISIVIIPVVLFQVFKSWSLANEKLKEGPLIENLD